MMTEALKRGCKRRDPELSRRLGRNLQSLRLGSGMTQWQIGKVLGVDQVMVSLWECARSRPSLEHLLVLADLYDISLDELVGRNSGDET